MKPVDVARDRVRRNLWWLRFQEGNREGWRAVRRRWQIQRQILPTPPIRTARAGPTEVRVLTWRRDWVNVIWALKSFYHASGVEYPLVIHDGGLAPGQADILLRHFPDATFVPSSEAEARIAREFTRRGLVKCLEYRRLNPSTLKLFDFFAFSSAEHVLTIDSDIVFFRRPDELVDFSPDTSPNLYNKDAIEAYTLTPDELEVAFGVRPPPRINSGLGLARRVSIDFESIERWLHDPRLFENRWVTEQTLHAMCSARYGVALLPPTYRVSVEPGLDGDLVCKHYPGFFRPLLYSEGMAELASRGFLRRLDAVPLRERAGLVSPR